MATANPARIGELLVENLFALVRDGRIAALHRLLTENDRR